MAVGVTRDDDNTLASAITWPPRQCQPIEIQNNKIIEASNRLTYKQTQYIRILSLSRHISTRRIHRVNADDDKYLHFQALEW